MISVVIEVVGWAATAITCFQVARQARDLVGTGEATGVSAPTWGLALVQSLGLLLFSVRHSFWAAVATNGIVGIFCYIILAQLAIKLRSRLTIPLLATAGTLLPVLVMVFLGADAAGSAGAAASAVVWVPQAVHAFVTRAEAGLSAVMVTAGVASSLLWLAYGVLLRQWRLMVSPSVALVSFIVTAAFAFGLFHGRLRGKEKVDELE